MDKMRKLLVTILFSILFALIFKWWTTGNPFHPSTVLFGTTTLIIIQLSLSIANKFFQNFFHLPVKQVKIKIIPAFLLFLLIILFISLVVIGLTLYVFYLIMGIDTANFISTLFTIEFPDVIRSYFVCSLIVSSYFFYIIWRQAINREQRLREENLKHKYTALKNQVNPHFLFNSLNTLSEIIYEDVPKADNYIQKLAAIYRFILSHEDTDLLPLTEELEFVNQYFNLQKERSGNKIHLEIHAEDADNYQIIPVSLQILVENAIKHNSASEKSPLKIGIFIAQEFIMVSNNIQRVNTLKTSTGTGLLNLKERVKLIMHKEMIISEHNNQFTVKLPIINIQK